MPQGDVVALVLTGGLGTRLRGVVGDRPKALAEISGRPFLSWQLDALARQGVTHAVLCTGHLSEMIEAVFPAGRLANGVVVSHSREPRPLGTGGALRRGLEMAPGGGETVLGVNGDTFCAFDLPAFAAAHRPGACGTLLLAQVEDAARYGSVETDDRGLVTRFREKAAAGTLPPGGWISAGIYLLSRRHLGELPLDQPLSIEREVFPGWIGRGLSAYRGGSRFLDIGTPESYACAASYLREDGGPG